MTGPLLIFDNLYFVLTWIVLSDQIIVLLLWNPLLMLLTIDTSCVVLSNLKHCQTKTLRSHGLPAKLYQILKKRQHYFALYCQNKIPKDFYTHFRNFVTGKLDNQKRYIMNIKSMLQKLYKANLVHHQ